MNQDLISYYNDRAKEYNKVYLIPEEQNDLIKATKIFQDLFFQKTVLEIACGTGYWTDHISKSASSILAIDINESVIKIAKSIKNFENVVFEVADMYNLKTKSKYSSLFGGFIWSHILLQDIDNFIDKSLFFLEPNATLVFIDSKQLKGTNHDINKITKTDEQGNTYQTRILENGTHHLVLKNFPTQEFLLEKLSKFSTDIKYIDLDHYWIVTCKIRP